MAHIRQRGMSDIALWEDDEEEESEVPRPIPQTEHWKQKTSTPKLQNKNPKPQNKKIHFERTTPNHKPSTANP